MQIQISGINPNNKIYYKIVAKSDNVEDGLIPFPMPIYYTWILAGLLCL